MPIGGTIAGIGSALVGGIGLIGRKKRQKKQYAHENAMANKSIAANQQLAKYGYQQSRYQWQRENEYNTPERQMARFKEAGLNPNLIYGQGNAGNASSMQAYQSPTADYTGVSNPQMGQQQAQDSIQQVIQGGMSTLDAYMNTKKKAAETDLIAKRAATENWSKHQKQATTHLTKTQQESLHFRNIQQQQLMEMGDKNQWSDNGLSNYNQRIVDQEYSKIRMQQNNATKAAAEAAFKNMQITEYRRDQIIRGLGGAVQLGKTLKR